MTAEVAYLDVGPVDSASVTQVQPDAVGGIDLNGLDMGMTVRKDVNGGVKVDFDPAMIERIRKDGVQNVVLVIINVTPMTVTDIRPLLGLAQSREEEKLAGFERVNRFYWQV